MSVKNGLRAHLLELAARPEGVCAWEITGWNHEAAVMGVSRLKTDGLAFVVGSKQKRRAFLNEADAKRYTKELADQRVQNQKRWSDTSNERAKAKRAATPKPPKMAKPAIHRKSAVEVGVKIKTPSKVEWANREAIKPAHVRVQKCPSPPLYGPAARLMHVSPAQLSNRLPELKAGKDL